jgi:3-hydroxyisobutyrate dehydrogenase-like beta-hydroxyacid dehydrogenase
MADVAVLGTGRMGAAMARRVAEAGHRVTVWNRTAATAVELASSMPERSIVVAESPARAVRRSDVVLSVLADGAATEEVLLNGALLDVLPPGCLVCDLATSGVATARALEAGITAAGGRFVDAPVSGSVPSVEAGTLLVMAGGDPEVVDTASSVLSAFARAVIRVGAAGTGQAMKLAVNLVVHDINSAIGEALMLAEGAGIAREQAYDVLQESVVAAPFVTYKRAAFLDAGTPVAMSLDLVLKDLGLIIALAEDVGSPHRVTRASREWVAAACQANLGGLDMAALSRFSGDSSVL